MLKITSKKYEIEEPIQYTKNIDGNEEIIYEFKMQINEQELNEIKHILFDYTNDNINKYMKATKEEREQLEKEAEEEIKSKNERFIDICFKEHKDIFKEKAGEIKFDEMIEEMRGYFYDFFMKKQISRINTPITDLMKNINNLQNLK